MSGPEPDPQLEALLRYLNESRGFDFTRYKRATLGRRIQRRMMDVGVESYDAYTDYLEVHADEFALLFDTILINVTSFFRDPDAWQALATQVIPRLVDSLPSTAPIRVWSAGCSTGEETYTLAILLVEALGDKAFRRRVKIFGTDLDDAALAVARHGTYSAKAIGAIPAELREKYFDPAGSDFTFHNGLRRALIFGRHDLTTDAPISRLDLLACRNTLMYLNADVQASVLARFYFALNEHGVLMLGKAEMVLGRAKFFTALDMRARLFVKDPHEVAPHAPPMASPIVGDLRHLRELAIDSGPIPHIVISRSGLLVAANEPARTHLGVGEREIGRPFAELEISYRPAELRSALERAYADRRPVEVRNVARTFPDGRVQHLDITVYPLPLGDDPLGATIVFADVTQFHGLQDELKHSTEELHASLEELQSTNEELETSNEELQATIEELETTNEELQSANEELETMNEELQATNEELATLNEELRIRGEELDQTNTFLESILASEPAAVVVLDDRLHVQLWNAVAEDLWGLRAGEVRGEAFLALDFGLMPANGLATALRECADGGIGRRELMLDARDRRGRPLHCRVVCTPLVGQRGVVLMMQAEQA